MKTQQQQLHVKDETVEVKIAPQTRIEDAQEAFQAVNIIIDNLLDKVSYVVWEKKILNTKLKPNTVKSMLSQTSKIHVNSMVKQQEMLKNPTEPQRLIGRDAYDKGLINPRPFDAKSIYPSSQGLITIDQLSEVRSTQTANFQKRVNMSVAGIQRRQTIIRGQFDGLNSVKLQRAESSTSCNSQDKEFVSRQRRRLLYLEDKGLKREKNQNEERNQLDTSSNKAQKPQKVLRVSPVNGDRLWQMPIIPLKSKVEKGFTKVATRKKNENRRSSYSSVGNNDELDLSQSGQKQESGNDKQYNLDPLQILNRLEENGKRKNKQQSYLKSKLQSINQNQLKGNGDYTAPHAGVGVKYTQMVKVKEFLNKKASEKQKSMSSTQIKPLYQPAAVSQGPNWRDEPEQEHRMSIMDYQKLKGRSLINYSSQMSANLNITDLLTSKDNRDDSQQEVFTNKKPIQEKAILHSEISKAPIKINMSLTGAINSVQELLIDNESKQSFFSLRQSQQNRRMNTSSLSQKRSIICATPTTDYHKSNSPNWRLTTGLEKISSDAFRALATQSGSRKEILKPLQIGYTALNVIQKLPTTAK